MKNLTLYMLFLLLLFPFSLCAMHNPSIVEPPGIGV